ncbi:MAG: SHOCT domain-containing protein [Polaribacter sp.]
MNPEQNKLPSTSSGLIVTIKKIKKYNRRRYKGVIFTIGGGNITNYLLRINEAIASCEVTPCPNKKVNVVNTTESKYDKLKKIKDLLDSGVLTKEEFEKENTK